MSNPVIVSGDGLRKIRTQRRKSGLKPRKPVISGRIAL